MYLLSICLDLANKVLLLLLQRGDAVVNISIQGIAACVKDRSDNLPLPRPRSVCCVASQSLTQGMSGRNKKMLSRLKVKVNCRQNLITFRVHHRFLVSKFFNFFF